MRHRGWTLGRVGAALLAAACSTSETSAPPGSNTGAERDAGGASASAAAGPGASSIDAGPVTIDAAPSVRSYGPDRCGDGVDDDGDGIIDDGCVHPGCTLTVKSQFEIPLDSSGSVVFDHAHHAFAVSAMELPAWTPAITRWDESGQRLPGRIELSARGSLFGMLGGYVEWSAVLPPYTDRRVLRLDSNLTVVGTPQPVPLTRPQVGGDWMLQPSGGALWAAHSPSRDTLSVSRVDLQTLAVTPLLDLTFPPDVTSTNVDRLYPFLEDVGGIPVAWVLKGSDTEERFSFARLSATTWQTPVLTDDLTHLVAALHGGLIARSDRTMLSCSLSDRDNNRNGVNRHLSCYTVDVLNGASFHLNIDYANGDRFPWMMLDWGADSGWIVARQLANSAATPPMETIRIDRISSTGILSAGLLDVTVPPLGHGRATFRTIAPNVHVLMLPRQDPAGNTGQDTTTVVVLGCGP